MTGNVATLGIPLAFLGMITLIIWYIIGGQGKWWAKVLIIALTGYLSLGLWYSMDGLLGWPTSATPPNKFQAHWIVAQPPKNSDPDSGKIFLWATDLQPEKSSKFGNDVPPWVEHTLFPFHTKKQENEPRLYSIPYSKDLHQQANKIIENYLKKGKPFMGTMKGPESQDKGNGKGKGKGKGKGGGPKGNGENGRGQGSFSRDNAPPPMFYELPPPKFPEKITNPEG